MQRTIRLGVIMALAACGKSKTDDHSASGSSPAPAAPPDAAPAKDVAGVHVQPEGDHVVLTDPKGGVRIELPGAPELEDTGSGMTATLDDGNASLVFTITRLQPNEVSKDVDKAYASGLAAAKAKAGATEIESGPVRLGGHDGFHLVEMITDTQGTTMAKVWWVELPDAATLYQVLLTDDGQKNVPDAWLHVVDTFKDAK